MPNINLGVYFLDDCQRGGVTIHRLLQLISDPVLGPLPGADSANLPHPPLGVIAPVVGHVLLDAGHIGHDYKIAMVSPNGGGEGFADRDKYPTVFGINSSITLVADILLKIIAYFKWYYFTLIYSDRVRDYQTEDKINSIIKVNPSQKSLLKLMQYS